MYKPTIGIEVHIELNTKSKAFCSCLNDSDEKRPNINICPICTGHPGTLPVVNKKAIRKVIKTGLVLNCQISKYSQFDRKNYFYPDLPKGYQISQQYFPFCQQGFLKIDNKKIRIRKIHLEEDTAKLIHQKDHSLIDFNRAGVSLMELVTEPDIKSAIEARKFAEELQLILRYLNVSQADMEKGEMRIEANVSLTKNIKKLGTKVEIKNLNSFRAVEKGIDYEIKRQTDVLNSEKKVVQETRGWDDNKEITFTQRKKEESGDYRYFPEPDLPPFYQEKEFIEKIKAEILELPQQRRERFKKEYNLLEKEVENFVNDKKLGEYFEKVISELPPELSSKDLSNLTKLVVNYIISDLQGLMKIKEVFINSPEFLIIPENFAEFICLIYEGKISSKIAKIVLKEMFETGYNPSNIIEKRGLVQISDKVEIEKIIKEVILKNPKALADYKKGKQNAFQFLIGQIMAKSQGKANPQVIQQILTKFLYEKNS